VQEVSQIKKTFKGVFASDLSVPYWMLIPGVIGIVFTNIIPSFRAVLLGFQEKGSWVWFKNYAKIVSDGAFWQSLTNTFFWSAGTLVCSTIIGLFAAILLNRSLPGRSFFRTIFIVPWVTPPVVAAMVWKYLYDQSLSPFNFLLKTAGIIQDNISFLGNPQWQVGPVTVPMLSVLVINIWATFPFMMVMILAALQNISDALYEAAQIDGAGKIKQFFHITLPSITPVLGISLLLQGIWQFNSFNLNYLVANGGPLGTTKTLAVSIYQEAFMNFDTGAAGAISGLMLLCVMIPAIFYIRKSVKSL
jgi:ABC-type sugar transport system permease subunit